MGFLEQIEKLRFEIPQLALLNFQESNAEYGNFTFRCKNCYLCIGSDFLENCSYIYWGYHNFDCVDCSYSSKCRSCFECLDCFGCRDSAFLQDCQDCENCFACFDCQSLKDCFCCIGLKNKQYYIYNRPYSKEEYEEKMLKMKQKSPHELRKLFKEVKLLRPHASMHEKENTGTCIGDYFYASSDCYYCFDTSRSHRSLYMNNAINCTDCCDISYAGEPSVNNCYEIMSGMGLVDCNFCNSCWHGKNLEYCNSCFDCENCFGCVGLKGKKFYILNKPYQPDEYFQEVRKIKEMMKQNGSYGKWFSSTFPLEDSKAVDEFSRIHHHLV